MNSVKKGQGEVATLRAWRDLTAEVRNDPANKNPDGTLKSRGLCVWFHDLVAAVNKEGFDFVKEDGKEVLDGAALTRFLNKARKNLQLNFQKGGMPSDEAETRCSIGGPNFLKIEVLVEMDTGGF